MKNKNKKLQMYSALSLAFVFIQQKTSAQINYVDFDPDLIVSGYNDWEYIDLDMDGIKDLIFDKFALNHYDWPFGDVFIERLAIGGLSSGYGHDLSILGTLYPYFTAYCTCYLELPLALEEGYLINEDKPFNNGIGYHNMAYLKFLTWFYEYPLRTRGNWFPEVEDHYVGIRFNDEVDEYTHYGWVRCTVLDSGRTLIIKDYAYELKSNHSILAGQTSYETAIQETDASDFIVYSYASKIIFINQSVIKNPLEIFIYDMTGEKIYTENLSQQKTEIDFSKYASGVYVVEVISDENKFVKKVWVE